MRVTYIKSESVAKYIKSYWFRPEATLRFGAGQCIELHNPHETPDSRSEKRWFTISSSPLNELFSITTKIPQPGKRSSYKNTLESLKKGDKLSISNPIGDFVLPKDSSIPLIFIAGGIGCTPYNSMIKYLMEISEHRDITLLHSATNSDDFIFDDTFSNLGNKFIKLKNVRLTAKNILKLTRPSPEHYIYLSGPEPMVEELQKDLTLLGIARNRIIADFFSGYI